MDPSQFSPKEQKRNQQVCYRTFGSTRQYLALINRTEGLYGRILIEVCKCRPNAVRLVHTTKVKILPYRPTKLNK